jgi:hypothetical protein
MFWFFPCVTSGLTFVDNGIDFNSAMLDLFHLSLGGFTVTGYVIPSFG